MNEKNQQSILHNRIIVKRFLSLLFCCVFFTGCMWERPVKIKGIFTLPKILEQATGAAGTDSCSSKIPSEPTAVSISSTVSPLSVSVRWTNPKDCTPETVTVVRKTGSVPSDKTDGTSIPVNSDKAGFTDTNVSASTMYYYKIFLGNRSGTYSKGTSVPVMAGSTSVVMAKIPDSSVVMDGMDSDSVWSSAPKISFSFPVLPTYADYTGGNDLNVTGYIRFAYDSSYLYIFYHTDDKYLRIDSPGAPYDDDSVELYFDFGFHRTSIINNDNSYRVLILTPFAGSSAEGQSDLGGWWNYWGFSGDVCIYSPGTTLNYDGDIDNGWSMEVRVPLSSLGTPSIVPGKVIGFTFFINDDDLSPFSDSEHQYPWTSGGDIFVPNSWGILQFQ